MKGWKGWTVARRVFAWIVGLYLVTVFVPQGVDKFDPGGMWAGAFERWGYPVWLRLTVGALEVGGGVALIVPWIASWGAAAVSVVMAGAFFTRALDGRWVDVAWIASYLAASLWVGYEFWTMRRPRDS